MRHRKSGRRLGRNSSHLQATMRNMVTSLLEHERIVTLGKRGDLHARRQALAVIQSKEVVNKLFTKLRNEYMDRNGGYTRIIRTGNRNGDAAPMAIIELVNYTEDTDEVTN
jgi:large subunit ribosomal protein L17